MILQNSKRDEHLLTTRGGYQVTDNALKYEGGHLGHPLQESRGVNVALAPSQWAAKVCRYGRGTRIEGMLHVLVYLFLSHIRIDEQTAITPQLSSN
jgi:hypothetical protein